MERSDFDRILIKKTIITNGIHNSNDDCTILIRLRKTQSLHMQAHK